MALSFPHGVSTVAGLVGACLVWTGLTGAAPPADWATGGPLVGQPVTLPVGERSVPALYRAHQGKEARGAILLLPAPGDDADAAGLVRALRLGLPDAGWDTLSVQLPAYFPGDSPVRWLERHGALQTHIRAGSTWLRERGRSNQVIIAMGPSGHATLAFAAGSPPDTLQALTLISTAIEPGSAAANQLAELRLPVLDLYAERDRRDVLDTLSVRRQAAVDNSAFRQRIVPGTDDRFTGAHDAAVAAVRAWLAANADRSERRAAP
jgi:hypothetical protein